MPDRRVRGPQPQRRPKRETVRVLTAVEGVLDRYRDRVPVSLRQLFYVLPSDGVLAKTERDYKRMCEYVGMVSHSGRTSWDVIRDDTQIAVDAPPSFSGPTGFWAAVESAADDYRVDSQAGQPVRLELWSETPVLYPVTVVAHTSGHPPPVTAPSMSPLLGLRRRKWRNAYRGCSFTRP